MTRRIGSAGLLSFALVTMGLCGCHATGPGSIRAARGNYNIAIQQTNNQQQLLNLVRLKYRDTPGFLAVSSIPTGFTFEVGGGATVGDVADLGVVGVASSLAYAEKPTVTYAPLQGRQFVNQLMSPMSLRVLLLLSHSGWRIDPVPKTCLQSIGELPNAPGAASPTPVAAPEYEEFANLARNLRTLQAKGLIDEGQTGKRVTVTLDADGRLLDRSSVTGELLRVRFSDKAPDNACTGISYFSLLTQILALQAGSEELQGPVLTLPVC